MRPWGAWLCRNPIGDRVPDAPVITVSVSPETLWPPNEKLITARVSGTITDAPDGPGVKSAASTVKDEYGQIQRSGSITPRAGRRYAFTGDL
jgi:hypothetical protein